MPLLAQETVHPDEWAGRLKNLSDDAEHAITASLKNAEKAAVILGAEVQNHPDYAAIMPPRKSWQTRPAQCWVFCRKPPTALVQMSWV